MDKGSPRDNDIAAMRPQEFRRIARESKWIDPTSSVCRGYVQANLVIVPKDIAFEFLLFCNRNPRLCPVIDVTDPDSPCPKRLAPEADIRTDLPRYRVYINGELKAEPTNIIEYWRDDLIGFLIGCSFSFDWSLRANNIQFRFLGAYTTNIRCIPTEHLNGHMVVTCRLFRGLNDAMRGFQISSWYPRTHGTPIHIGDPSAIGIKDLYHPDAFAATEAISLQESDEIALFWGCGITPQTVAMESKIPFMITHYPGCMFVTDRLIEEEAFS